MNYYHHLIMTALLCAMPFLTTGQDTANTATTCPSPCWGDYPEKAKEAYALFSDHVQLEEYQAAEAHFIWLIKHAPLLGKALYIYGEKMYQRLEKKATATVKIDYQDKLLTLYEVRMRYYGKEERIIRSQQRVLYRFWSKRTGYETRLTKFYENALKSGYTSWNNVMYYQLALSRLHKKSTMTVTDIENNYHWMSSLVESSLEKMEGEKRKKWMARAEWIDKTFVDMMGKELNCEYLNRYWNTYLRDEAAPKSTQVQKVLTWMSEQGCKEEPIFMTALETLVQQSPTIPEIDRLVLKYQQNNQYEKIEPLLMKRLALAQAQESLQEEATTYVKLAKLKLKLGKQAAGRDYYLKAIEADKSRASVYYTEIANLYMNNYEICLSTENMNPVKDRITFLAAYEMYQKAGNQEGMRQAAEQFPTMVEIFQYGYKIGELMYSECWIGGSYKLRKRS